jgi:sodium/potassium-transporting ATPase subunit alpha
VCGRIAGLIAKSEGQPSTLLRDIHQFIVFIKKIVVTVGITFFVFGLAMRTAVVANFVSAIGMIFSNVPDGPLATVRVCLTTFRLWAWYRGGPTHRKVTSTFDNITKNVA